MADVDLARRPRLGDMKRVGGPADAQLEASVKVEAAQRERRLRVSPPEKFAGRTGYDADFLAFGAPLPTPTGPCARDVLETGTAGNRLDYEHFSVVMSQSRRMAMFVAVNIDGGTSIKINRDSDTWFLDGRIPIEAQLGEELYAQNLLDRGHLVRREDPNWGDEDTAETANEDTFHFTNCSPQMAGFNQRTWLGLEDYLLINTRKLRERVTVLSGPVFGNSDLQYRGALIPLAYWKVVAFTTDDGKPSATAYMIDQEHELTQLEAAFGRYKTYQRSVRRIERLTGLDFGRLREFDGFSNEEAATGTEIEAVIRTLGDLRV
jgi:endonuclease G